MTVQLNHTIVPARDKDASALFLSEVLGLDKPFPFGPFMAVQVDSLTLDYVEVDGEIESRHYAFLVSEAEFDEIFGRITEREIPYWADPQATEPQQINTRWGGRGCYFPDPDGHWLEILTKPYGSG